MNVFFITVGGVLGLFLFCGFMSSSCNKSNATLIDATKDGDLELVRQLIISGEDVNQRDNSGFTPLFYSALRDDIDIARVLLAHGALVDAEDKKGSTPIFLAVQNKRDSLEMLKLLVSAGANIDQSDKYGWTPLLYSVDVVGSNTKAQFLLEKGANPNVQSDVEQEFPLRIAISWRNSIGAKLLLDYEANPNLQRSDGKTALMEACQRSDQYIVEMLLSKGADPRVKNSEGHSAIDFVPVEDAEVRRLIVERLR